MADAIGSISKLTGVVKARHADGSTDVLHQGAPVFQGDTLETGDGSSVGVVFVDKSTFSLGAKGRMVMDEMVFDPAHPSDGHATIVALNGAFSFVSGQVAKTAPDAMTIKTPVMTIGVRGTSGAGIASPEGSQNTVTLLRDGSGTLGQISIANAAGSLILNSETQTIQASSYIQAFAPPRQLSAAEVQNLYGQALEAQPVPPAPPPVEPQTTPQPSNPSPAGGGEGNQAQPEHSQNGNESPTTPPTPDAPVDPTQVGVTLEELNVWLANWINAELDPADLGLQGDGNGDDGGRDNTDDDLAADDDEPVDDGRNTIIGTVNGDSLTGTDGADDIYGLAGDDYIYAQGGNDSITPGSGYDRVFAGDGDDVIEMTLDHSFDTVVGGAGRDTLSYASELTGLTVDLGAGTVNDSVYSDGFSGIEVFVGGLGDDQVTGSTLADTVYGGLGNDMLIGNQGDDVLYGEVGNDVIEGGLGDDTLYGGTGNDQLKAADGADTLYGGTGDDTLFLTTDNFDDTVDGGTGVDTVSFWSQTAPVEVSLSAGTATYVGTDAQTYTDTLIDVENVVGGSGNDRLTGDGGSNSLDGGAGDDTLDGGAGNDTLSGDTGSDTLIGGDGNDSIILTSDSATDVVKISGTSFQTAGVDSISGFEVGTDQIKILADVFTNLSNPNVNYGTDLASAMSSGSTQIIGVDNGGAVDLYYVTAAGQSYQIASIADTTTTALSSAGSVAVV